MTIASFNVRRRHPTSRGSVIIIVLWAIAIAALVTTGVQLFSHRQATLGREALERVQARWAARAGMEDVLSIMRDYTERPDPDDAFAMARAMGNVSQGDTIAASYDIRHHVDGRDLPGPMDEHSKLNLNKAEDRGGLMILDDMQYDIYDAITDWIDPDNQASALGVERDWYQGQSVPLEPRNGPLRNTSEMELIAGVWPQYFRGEDWNLDNRLDANENDGRRSLPPDNADGRLDAGWSGAVTVYSVAGGATATGKPRIYLREAQVTDLIERFQLAGAPITDAQAQYLIQLGSNEDYNLESLLSQQSNTAPGTGGTGGTGGAGGQGGTGGTGGTGGAGGQNTTPQFTAKQTQVVLNETSVKNPYDRQPGKMNINTISAWLLRDLLDKGMSLDEGVADEIIYMRQSGPEGIVNLEDLKKIQEITPQIMDQLMTRFGTSSNVFTISSRGRSWASGIEVEIVAVVDRSTVPIRIIEYREQ